MYRVSVESSIGIPQQSMLQRMHYLSMTQRRFGFAWGADAAGVAGPGVGAIAHGPWTKARRSASLWPNAAQSTSTCRLRWMHSCSGMGCVPKSWISLAPQYRQDGQNLRYCGNSAAIWQGLHGDFSVVIEPEC